MAGFLVGCRRCERPLCRLVDYERVMGDLHATMFSTFVPVTPAMTSRNLSDADNDEQLMMVC